MSPVTQAACERLNTSTANARAAVTHGGSVWALLFPTRVPLPVGTALKVVWRVTGTGEIQLHALGPAGETIAPIWIEPHGGSTFQKPGEEWGSGFALPSAGCWDLRASRRGVSGDIWIWVTPATEPG